VRRRTARLDVKLLSLQDATNYPTTFPTAVMLFDAQMQAKTTATITAQCQSFIIPPRGCQKKTGQLDSQKNCPV